MDNIIEYAEYTWPAFRIMLHSNITINDPNILLEIISYMPFPTHAMNELAKNGNIYVMKWARLNGCPWNWYVCTLAAKYGHLECLKWLRSNPNDLCPWNKNRCISGARKNNHQHIIDWINDN